MGTTVNNHNVSTVSGAARPFPICFRVWSVLALTLLLLFLTSLFKNISYPLLWADESMAVMHGERVLEYGYPKVHGGKNVLYDLRHPNPGLGIDEKTDAYIGGANWGQYYVAALGVKLAQISKDLYVKTAIVRIPFALAGLAGLALLAFLAMQFFDSSSSRAIFLSLFAFLELISVPLVLHLREARYYSPTILLLALVIFIYARFHLLRKGGYKAYFVLLPLSLLLLYLVFSPAYFICIVSIFIFDSLSFAATLLVEKKGGAAGSFSAFCKAASLEYLKNVLPLLVSLLAVAPFQSFFKTFYIAEEMAKFNKMSSGISPWNMYLENLSTIWTFLTSFDLLYLALFLKAAMLLSCIGQPLRSRLFTDGRKILLSSFLTVLFAVYFFVIPHIPNFLFTRYFIPLQPVLAVIILLDAALLYRVVSSLRFSAAIFGRILLPLISAGFIAANVAHNISYLKGHVYELFHQYKGPLDYVIPFIEKTYKDPSKLVIATNYEETSYMYYLDAKVIVGYVGNNLQEDARMVPDVIVYRVGWENIDIGIFRNFLRRNSYRKVTFPVEDYRFNNVPELNLNPDCEHQFRTLNTEDDNLKVSLFLKR